MKYYVDTCIWLNLFKKEGDSSKGIPYWGIAEDFIASIRVAPDHEILYSGIVLRELELKQEYYAYQRSREYLEPFHKVIVLTTDKLLARKLEQETSFMVSFYDLVHLAIAKRVGAVLVTRDGLLIATAKAYGVEAARPEEITMR